MPLPPPPSEAFTMIGKPTWIFGFRVYVGLGLGFRGSGFGFQGLGLKSMSTYYLPWAMRDPLLDLGMPRGFV